ncbi:D-isomer specific 2-hydroxyacid dehydrogenase [Raphidocelis subcapitata]|uniref:D-isomer specific 2-hydroxyacid dehydrogenase n=1 Tax=Raphidocelis subcapitata TaxID=307507 RepID=A0A2V0PHF8_9CHLO|nr:D-isomer specific 2-hydroxyacid dehydrogenase [Raphidocelis subcapitata]|eukprot:GBF97360.1 D-isomer specific 2-hydroxyacid dehydrogenase [Raphidocelis subcapitata]
MRLFGVPSARPSTHTPGQRRAAVPAAPKRRGAAPAMAASSVQPAKPGAANILVVAGKETPELSVLEKLPPGARVLAIGQTAAELDAKGLDWGAVDVLLNCGVGKNAGKRDDVREMWPRLKNLRWLHSASAGLEHLLFPELVEGPVVLTNAKGVYSHSLAEYALTCCSWFAKDFPRLIAAKDAKNWDPYDVEELRGKTLGVVGYGDIGQATAKLARAFRMRVIALRRRAELSEAEKEEGVLDAMYPPEQLPQLMAASDYVVVATPLTPSTEGLVSREAIAAMRPNGVLVNVGRGRCVDEDALIDALRIRHIRGAALDVFATEPLPASSPLWELPNVFVSPHCADRTKEFQFESLERFVDNVGRYMAGGELLAVADKRSGY